jgi:hypothetical protein
MPVDAGAIYLVRVRSVGASQRTSVYTDYHLFGPAVKGDRSNAQMADADVDLEPSFPHARMAQLVAGAPFKRSCCPASNHVAAAFER